MKYLKESCRQHGENVEQGVTENDCVRSLVKI